MRWTRDRYSIEMRAEPTYSFGSADNVRRYDKEILLVQDGVTSKYGLVSFRDDRRTASIVVGSGGARSAVHERSVILVRDLCFAAVGSHLLCLTVPALDVRWHREADPATCFGLHLIPHDEAIVVHGEREISKWTFEGRRLWAFEGADVFTGAFSIAGGTAVVEDFEGRSYAIDLRTGRGEPRSA